MYVHSTQRQQRAEKTSARQKGRRGNKKTETGPERWIQKERDIERTIQKIQQNQKRYRMMEKWGRMPEKERERHVKKEMNRYRKRGQDKERWTQKEQDTEPWTKKFTKLERY